MGDSITYYWGIPGSNFGVPGNTTAQMLDRFPAQVLAGHYKALVLLGGTNDIRNAGVPVETAVNGVIADLETMAQQAENAGMLVVLCAIPPIQISSDTPRVESLNAAIQTLAASRNYRFVDFYTPMAGHPEYFRDTLHPNEEGYLVMTVALEKAIKIDY